MGRRQERKDKNKKITKNSGRKNNTVQVQDIEDSTFDDNKKQVEVLVPSHYVNQNMLGEEQDENWNNPDNWLQYYQKNGTLDFLKKVFNNPGEENLPESILRSLHSPCEPTAAKQICWRIHTSVRHENRKKGEASPFMIVNHKNDAGKIIANIVYDQNGKSRFMIDFANHGGGEVHIHGLLPGQFDRINGEDHCLSWRMCPWIWLAIPTDLKKKPALNTDNEHHIGVKINYDPDKVLETGISRYPLYIERLARRRMARLQLDDTQTTYNQIFKYVLMVVIMIVTIANQNRQGSTASTTHGNNAAPSQNSYNSEAFRSLGLSPKKQLDQQTLFEIEEELDDELGEEISERKRATATPPQVGLNEKNGKEPMDEFESNRFNTKQT